MPFDAFVLKCVAGEIENRLISTRARITKIYQLGAADLTIHFRSEFKNQILFLSAHPTGARIHLTTHHYPSPPTPPPFCMLLRKHLTGTSIISLEQPLLERVLKLNLQGINTGGGTKTLVVEIMERRSNLILLDEQDKEGKQVILGAIKAVPPFMNRFRTILPHHQYTLPPPQDKIHPMALDYKYFQLEAEREEGRPVVDFVLDKLRGFSPFLAREIAARAGLDKTSKDGAPLLWAKLQELLQFYTEDNWEPTMICDREGKPLDFAAFKPRQENKGLLRSFQTMSEVLEEYYLYRQKQEKKDNLRQLITRQIGQLLEKARKREKKQLAEVEKANQGDYYRLCGELLNINLHAVPHKATEIVLRNVYSEKGEEVKINLDPRLSPSENAQRYFKKYRKAGNTLKKITARLSATRREIAYLESVLYNVEKSDLEGLQEIRLELEEGGYIAGKPKAPATDKNPSSKPLKYITAGDEEVLVGRNNRQNDMLLRQAAATDLWFHVKDMPGAHVILKGSNPSKEGVEAAALLAASHSRGAQSGNVPVDYTPVKNVRRIPGAGPGMVTYTGYKTLFVTPEKEKLATLLQPSGRTN